MVVPSDEWQGDLTDINIGLGNGLLLSDNKPLPEPMLTQF